MIKISVFNKTRSSSADEIANVKFFYDDIVQNTIYNRLAHKFRHRDICSPDPFATPLPTPTFCPKFTSVVTVAMMT